MSFSQFSRKFLSPVVELLARAGIPPNLLTVIAALFTGMGAILIGSSKPLWAALWLIFFAPLDALDGDVARRTGRTSRFGAFLDSTLDRLTDGAIFSGFAFALRGYSTLLLFSLTALVLSYLISYIRARVEGLGENLTEGLMSRYPRFIGVIGLLFIWQFFFHYLVTAFLMYDLLLLLTVVQRLVIAYRRLGA
ncbi:MAG: CDP-alcohol phosphatidyltransferase family protein [Thermotogae bacterium]|nr:CDP-alcohol phosphatidyltransferase family protein [Thermotogota bacterium]